MGTKAKIASVIAGTAVLLLVTCAGIGSCRAKMQRIAARAYVLASSVWYGGGNYAPSGQPPLAILNEGNFSQFRAAFDAGSDGTRILLLVSPTCPLCLRGVSKTQEMLKKVDSADVRVLVVWEPILASDWGKPTRPALSRISDHRALQFWDKDHLVAKQLDEHLAAAAIQPSCCKSAGILWDTAVLYPKDVLWGGAPVYIAAPIAEREMELAQRMQLTLRSGL